MMRTLYELTGQNNRRFSPFCWRTRMALAHKGLTQDDSTIEYVPCSFTEKDKIAFANYDRYPLLQDGETIVADSWAIAEYLEDAYPEAPSLFGGARGPTEFLNAWADSALHPTMIKPILGDVFEHILPKDRDFFRQSRTERFGRPFEELAAEWADDKDALVAELRRALNPVRTMLRSRDWICGPDGPAYGDYIVFGAFQWARSISPTALLDESDPVYAWRGRMGDLFDGYAETTTMYPL